MKKYASLILIAILTTLSVSWLSRQRSVDAAVAPPQAQNVPVGSVIAWSGPKNRIPNGWLECDGREFPRLGTYNALFKEIGTTWGTSTPSTFKIPDLRGYFLRGVDSGSGRDPDLSNRTVMGTGTRDSAGSIQQDAFRKHSHRFEMFRTDGAGALGQAYPSNGNPVATDPNLIEPAGRDETRPKNAYVYFIIKARP